jgi:hypothetical protein
MLLTVWRIVWVRGLCSFWTYLCSASAWHLIFVRSSLDYFVFLILLFWVLFVLWFLIFFCVEWRHWSWLLGRRWLLMGRWILHSRPNWETRCWETNSSLWTAWWVGFIFFSLLFC